MQEIHMLLGERRLLVLSVRISDCDSFVLRDASYALEGADTRETGQAEIHGHELHVYIEPPKPGVYKLTATFHLGPERVKQRVTIIVSK